jgi:hypothetical protein
VNILLLRNFQSPAWWYMPVIPDTQEAEVGGSRPKAGDPYLRNKPKAKGLGMWLRRALSSVLSTGGKIYKISRQLLYFYEPD